MQTFSFSQHTLLTFLKIQCYNHFTKFIFDFPWWWFEYSIGWLITTIRSGIPTVEPLILIVKISSKYFIVKSSVKRFFDCHSIEIICYIINDSVISWLTSCYRFPSSHISINNGGRSEAGRWNEKDLRSNTRQDSSRRVDKELSLIFFKIILFIFIFWWSLIKL